MLKTNHALSQKQNNDIISAANLINLISGLYTSPLWDELRYYAASPETLRKLQAAIAALQDSGNTKAAFGLSTALYEIVGLQVPEAITSLAEDPDSMTMFVDEFLADTDEVLCDFEAGRFAAAED